MTRPVIMRSIVRNHLTMAYTLACEGSYEAARKILASLWFLNADNRYVLPPDLNSEARRWLSDAIAHMILSNRVTGHFDRSVYGAKLNRVGRIYEIDFWGDYRSMVTAHREGECRHDHA